MVLLTAPRAQNLGTRHEGIIDRLPTGIEEELSAARDAMAETKIGAGHQAARNAQCEPSSSPAAATSGPHRVSPPAAVARKRLKPMPTAPWHQATRL